MNQKIHIITLGVNDMESSCAFYETGLGWKRSSKSQGDIVFFDMQGIVFALYPKKKLAEDIGISLSSHGSLGITIAHNTHSPAEVDAIFQKIEDLGATILKRPSNVFWGGYSGYFQDRDGYIFEVAYNPFVSFDAQDSIV